MHWGNMDGPINKRHVYLHLVFLLPVPVSWSTYWACWKSSLRQRSSSECLKLCLKNSSRSDGEIKCHIRSYCWWEIRLKVV